MPPLPESVISVVGCGGTGGYVAEGLCRLFYGRENRIYLIDHDRVEAHNIGRQNFYPEDLGKFKAQVLAERLSRQFGREVNYLARPIDEMRLGEWAANVTIGCVDNPAARELMQVAGNRGYYGTATYYDLSSDFSGCWYIDAGNGWDSGQVLIGNAGIHEYRRSFTPHDGLCRKLPLPQVQQPHLIAEQPPVLQDCAEAVAREEQSPVINRMMADLVITFVHKLFAGTLGWMGAYIDIGTGSLSTVAATPAEVARICGITERQCEYRPKGGCHAGYMSGVGR